MLLEPAATNVSNTLCGIAPNDDGSFVPFLYTFVVISSVLVALRFVARLHKRMPIGWDDWTILGSVLVLVGWTTVCLIFRQYGAGRDIWALPQENITHLLWLFYISFFFYAIARCLVRVSIIIFMLRLFEIYDAKPLILTALVFNVALTFAFVWALIFQCSPVSYFWLKWDGEHDGKCIDQWALLLSAGILAIVFDVFIMLLPLRWIVQLQFSLLKKITTAVMLCLGVVVVAVSVERIIALRTFIDSGNFTSKYPPVVIWGGLDVHVAIICACLPSLRLMFSLLVSRVKARSSSSGSPGNSGPRQDNAGGARQVNSRIWRLRGESYPDLESSQIKMDTVIEQDSGAPSEADSVALHGIGLDEHQLGDLRSQGGDR
ncbi:hypothetical protein B0T19DRAFT_228895 [Cercophora scortea]|uniref:Rhodopsin domain-containing protein n=1 Tax=Cercophora scortea TaxID=314031 RepID=A0AAE0IG19_9PEZI|nr:hypothetical protein B0T19DRAFT_228895 [Cercophora scortea]